MNRRYVVLKTFHADLVRLLQQAEVSFAAMTATPAAEEVMKLYRPVHSLKGLCAMVDEGRDLAKVFHVLEDTLSEMLPVGEKHRKKVQGWRELVAKAIEFARGTELFVNQKITLWERFGAHENENRGLVLQVFLEGAERKIWVPITSLSGHFTGGTAEKLPESWMRMGRESGAADAVLVDFPGVTVLVYSEKIESIATRLEAIQQGVALSLKEFLSESYRRAA